MQSYSKEFWRDIIFAMFSQTQTSTAGDELESINFFGEQI